MVKIRVPIPEELVSEVLFEQSHTCCLCQEPGKYVQIHHIDEDPSNNNKANLAVLCLQCHNDTQITGGFGRKLRASEVTKYRDDWVRRVAERRARADDLMVQRQTGAIGSQSIQKSKNWVPPGKLELVAFVQNIPEAMKTAYDLAQPEWDTGVTQVMAQATYQMISLAERIWIGLSSWYPPNHFGEKPAPEYISAFTASRFEFRYAGIEPEGPGTSGTMVRPMVAYGVLLDLQEMIALTVRLMLLFREDVSIDVDQWEKTFRAATSSEAR